VTNDEDDISLLLNELSGFEMPAPNTKQAIQNDSPLDEKDTQQYFLDKTKAVIEASVGAVQDLTQATVQSGDAKDVEALAKLVASTAQMLDTLNKTNLIDKKADRDEQLEKVRIEGRKEVAQLNQGPKQITNNNVLVTSREDIMKRLMNVQKEDVIEIQQ
jgi:hypothetical protein